VIRTSNKHNLTENAHHVLLIQPFLPEISTYISSFIDHNTFILRDFRLIFSKTKPKVNKELANFILYNFLVKYALEINELLAAVKEA